MAKYSKKEYEAYVNAYPDLVDKKPDDMSVAEWGEHHYTKHGSKNKTRKTPEEAHHESKPAQQASSVKAANQAQKDKGNVFAGTNIPLSAIKDPALRQEFQERLAADIADGNTRGANDVIFGIAYAAGGNKGQGNPNVGAVQSGVWKLNNGPLWAQQHVNSSNDEYRLRDEKGNLTGKVVRFSDTAGVVTGTPTTTSRGRGGTEATGNLLKDADGNVISGDALTGGLTATDSWGGNAKAGIVAGQPTYKPSGATTWMSYGDDPGWETYFDSDPSLGPARVQNPKAGAPEWAGVNQRISGGSGLPTNVSKGLLDWSSIMPADQGLLSQAAISGGKGRYYQPHVARSGGLPASLLQYAVPKNLRQTPTYIKPWGGSGTDVTAALGNKTAEEIIEEQKVLRDKDLTDKGAADNQYSWTGADGKVKSGTFQQWSQAQHEAMYPGSQAAAAAAGFWGPLATNLNPAYRDYKDSQRQLMGLQPGATFNKTDWNSTFGNRTPAEINAMVSQAGVVYDDDPEVEEVEISTGFGPHG